MQQLWENSGESQVMARTGYPSTGRQAGGSPQFPDHLDYVACCVGSRIRDQGGIGRWEESGAPPLNRSLPPYDSIC